MDSESRPKMASPSTLCSFFTLAVIRGTFAVAVHYGITAYKSPSLLFLLRTPGTIALFVISVLYLASKNEEVKLEIVNDLKNSRSYKRAALLGFTQLCAPYLLFMYAMKYFSPSFGAVFMAATPWTTVLLEQVLVLTTQTVGGRDWNVIGSLVGVIGLVTVSVANICMVTLDTSCEEKHGYRNVTVNATRNGSHSHHITTEITLLKVNTCETPLEITTAFLALCGATLLWSISAAFSRLRRINLHFLSGGLLNNVFGGLYAVILWVLIDQRLSTEAVIWNSISGSISVIFLTLASSWVAAVVLYHLFRKIGAESTNRVMCLVPMITWVEDQVIVRDHANVSWWILLLEAIGIILVVIGLYLSSFRKGQFSRLSSDAPLLPDQYNTSDEEDNGVLQRVNELTEFVQSEEELEVSGSSSFQDSADPPMIHYADDEQEEEEQLW